MTKKSLSITAYISSLLQQYNEVKKELSPPTLYRLVDVKENSEGQYELFFQIIGKATVFKTTPEDILKNEKTMEFFSSKDIHAITKLACKKLNRPKKIIIGKSFSEKLCKLLFRINNTTENSIGEYTASELFNNKEIVKDLSPEDAFDIGYIAAQEKQEAEKNIIKRLMSII